MADDHYHKWREDVALAKGLGLTHYRCSIAWSRIVPDGSGSVNEKGLEFYDGLFDTLLAEGITPLVTLYHWDLPQALEAAGGWQVEATVDAFVQYAAVVFARFADRVHMWATFNEPHTFVRQGYSEGNHAPGRCSDRVKCQGGGDSWKEPYLVAHNVLRAHAKAVSLFRGGQWSAYGGRIGMVLNGEWAEPADRAEPSDVAAAELYLEQQVGWFGDPLTRGDYPAAMRARLGPRLPAFSPEDAALLKGSTDFFLLNFYNAVWVTALPQGAASDPATPFWGRDLGLASGGLNPRTGQAMGLQGESPWLFESPGGLRNMLRWVDARYLRPGALDVYVTENGCSAPGESAQALPGALNDAWRVAYHHEYLEAALASLSEDGVPLKGYFAWSLLGESRPPGGPASAPCAGEKGGG